MQLQVKEEFTGMFYRRFDKAMWPCTWNSNPKVCDMRRIVWRVTHCVACDTSHKANEIEMERCVPFNPNTDLGVP